MTRISSYSDSDQSTTYTNATQTKIATLTASADATIATTDSTTDSSHSAVSTLARQLADAAERAEARDASLSRSELADKAASINNALITASYTVNQGIHAAEVPDSDDPVRLAQAQQATDYVDNQGTNPFKGLSQTQLSLIIYDESGTFTVNERIAAYDESYDQEQQWRRWVCTMGSAESSTSGNRTHFYQNVLAHYQGLPLIEQAQYPDNYTEDLTARIAAEQSRSADETPDAVNTSESMQFFERLIERIKAMRGEV